MERQHLTSRRRFLAGAAAAVGATVLAACQPQVVEKVVEKPVEVTKVVEKEKVVDRPVEVTKVVEKVVEKPVEVTKVVEKVVAPAKAKGNLVFWGHDIHPIDEHVPSFLEQNPDVKWESVHTGEWLTKFKATLAAGAGVPDLIWLESYTIQELGAKGLLLDITDIVKPKQDKFVPLKLVETYIVKKGTYAGYPSSMAMLGFWYRADVLTKAGIKEDQLKDLKFDDFLKLMVNANKATGAVSVLFPKGGWYNPFDPYLSQLGGSYTSPDGTQVTIDDDKGIQAMTLTKKVWDTRATFDADVFSPAFWGALKGGKVAFDYLPDWIRAWLRTETGSREEGLGQWRVIPLPALPGGISRTSQWGGASITSTRFTKNPDGVKAFMDHAFGNMDGAARMAAFGNTPVWLPYLDSYLFHNQKDPIFGDYQFNKVWGQLVRDQSTKWTRTAVYGEARTIVQRQIGPIMRGEVTIPAGLKKIGDTIREANARYQD